MTVSSEVSRVAYNGNGLTTAFPTTFTFNDDTDLVVLKVLVADGTDAGERIGETDMRFLVARRADVGDVVTDVLEAGGETAQGADARGECADE